MRPIEWQSTSYPILYVSICDLFVSTAIRHKLRYAIPEDSSTCVRKETFFVLCDEWTMSKFIMFVGHNRPQVVTCLFIYRHIFYAFPQGMSQFYQ